MFVTGLSTAQRSARRRTGRITNHPVLLSSSETLRAKGRGLFATRKITEGEIISDEYPLITLKAAVSLDDFRENIYPNIDQVTKTQILQLNDPSNDFETLDTETVEKLMKKNTKSSL